MDKFKEPHIAQDNAMGKQFIIIPINEGENCTVTNHIDSVITQSRRANKRTLRKYLTVMGDKADNIPGLPMLSGRLLNEYLDLYKVQASING